MDTTDLIIVTAAVVAGSSLIKDVKAGTPHAGPIVFGFLLAGALLLVAVPAEKVARGLSYLALVGALAVNGPALFGVVGGLNPAKTTAAPAAPAQGIAKTPGSGPQA